MIYKLLLLILLLIISGCYVSDEQLSLGYCTTMEDFVHEKFPTYNLISYESSALVLQDLNNKKIDLAITGRKAYSFEQENLKETILENGYTFISKERFYVQYSDLNRLKLASLYEVDLGFDHVLVSSKSEGLENFDAVLINWEDFDDDNLMVILNGVKKSKLFRTPHLYGLK